LAAGLDEALDDLNLKIRAKIPASNHYAQSGVMRWSSLNNNTPAGLEPFYEDNAPPNSKRPCFGN
jgi:hypothetical protein